MSKGGDFCLGPSLGVFILMLATGVSPADCPEPWRRARLVQARRRRFRASDSDGGRTRKKHGKNWLETVGKKIVPSFMPVIGQRSW